MDNIIELIRRRRAQMLVHSYIYYRLDDNLISDHQWMEWAQELARLQDENKIYEIGYYDAAFKDWDGSSGFMLPNNDSIAHTARSLLQYKQGKQID